MTTTWTPAQQDAHWAALCETVGTPGAPRPQDDTSPATTPKPSKPNPGQHRARARCPHCTVRHLITANGRIRHHGPPGHPCPGSSTPAQRENPA